MADNDHEVPDATDWLSTPLAALAAVESSLRCRVCKDFYNTAMLTSCSHTFCSLCIRRALSNDSKCPLCRAPEQAIKLRGNWSMDEAVDAFKAARSAVLDAARSAGSGGGKSPKRKAEEINGDDESSRGGSKRLRSSARLSQRGSQQSPSYTVNVSDDEEEANHIRETADDDEDFTPQPDDGLYPCPSCQKRMKEWQIFAHLDSCPGPSPKKVPSEKRVTLGYGLTQSREHNKTLERLPTLNYSMLKDNALRKRLVELGISTQGARSLLERRHKEYITMWNANCDAARPKSRQELLRQLDAWEKTQGGKAPLRGKAAQNAAIIKDKDFDGSAWASQHNDSFKDLIASARKTNLEARQKAKEGDAAVATRQETGTYAASVGHEASRSAVLTQNLTVSTHPEETQGKAHSTVVFEDQAGSQTGSVDGDLSHDSKEKHRQPQGPTVLHVSDIGALEDAGERPSKTS